MNRSSSAAIILAVLVAVGGPTACADEGSHSVRSVAPIELRGDAGSEPPPTPPDGGSEARPVPPPRPVPAGDDQVLPSEEAGVPSPAPPPPADDDGPDDDGPDGDTDDDAADVDDADEPDDDDDGDSDDDDD